MKTYKEQEDELFERWMKESEKHGENNEFFAFDGVLYRGDFIYDKNDGNDDGAWNRNPGNETELWDNAPKRLLILTKDSTKDGELYDVRIEAGRANGKGADCVKADRKAFYDNLHIWSYGLLTACRGEEIQEFDYTPNWEELREFYETAPIARMNCKKQMGDNSISNSALKYYLDTYKVFITEQIEMYDADIILCCGGSDLILNFVKENYLRDLEPIVKDKEERWAYYSASKNKLVINSYHPSLPSARGANTYNAMMQDVAQFLKEYPDFTKPSR